jgi:hypothetical protein
MQSVHMNPAEAVQAHLDLEAAGKRRDAFWHIPVNDGGDRRTVACAGGGVLCKRDPQSRFRTLRFGESVRLE